MALADGYGNSIATKSQEARDHYERGVQGFSLRTMERPRPLETR